MTLGRGALYALFALIAACVNFGVQALAFRMLAGAAAVPISVLAGTLAGLAVKYVLDKRYIFRFNTTGLAHDGRLFVLYGVMSIATTVVFWGSEFGFGALFGNEAARYIGGAVGLAIGYVVKYQLDRRFVFRRPAA